MPEDKNLAPADETNEDVEVVAHSDEVDAAGCIINNSEAL